MINKENNTHITYERRAVVVMAFVCAISLLAIVGWVFNFQPLASFGADFIPMAPSTALVFLALCVAWLIDRYYPARPRLTILVQSILLGMLSIVFILALGYFTGFNLEIILFPNSVEFGQFESIQMSPLTGMGFILAIPAFLLMTGRVPGKHNKSTAAILALIVLILSSINILGYIYGAPLFYGGKLIPVAVTTAISFFFLSMSLLMTAGPAVWPARLFVNSSIKARLLRTFLPASLIIVLLQGFISKATAPWISNPALRAAVAALMGVSIVFFMITLIAKNLSLEIDESNRTRIKAESDLNRFEVRFRRLAESASDAIINIDQNGHIVFWNRASETIFGYTAEEAFGKSLEMIMQDDFSSAHQQGLRGLVSTGQSHIIGKTVELSGLRKNGDTFPLTLSLSTWQVEGDVFFTGMIRDISERKRSEAELLLKNAILSTQQETSLDGILVVDDESHIILFNQRFTEMWGIPPELIELHADKPILEFNANKVANRQEFLQQVKYLYENKLETSKDEIILKNNSIIERYSAPMIGSDDRYYGRVWYFRDITDRKQAEVALRESEERYRSLYENVPTGIYRTSPNGNILMANPALIRMLGYDTFEELVQRNQAQDLYASENGRQEFQNRIDRDGEVRSLESIWKCKDGSFLNVLENAYLVQNEISQPSY